MNGVVAHNMKFNTEQISTIEGYGLRLLSQDCPFGESKDKSLPNNAYVITCQRGEDIWHDIVIGSRSGIFDAYYDLFGHVVKRIGWTEGRVNPRVWQDPQDLRKKSKK